MKKFMVVYQLIFSVFFNLCHSEEIDHKNHFLKSILTLDYDSANFRCKLDIPDSFFENPYDRGRSQAEIEQISARKKYEIKFDGEKRVQFLWSLIEDRRSTLEFQARADLGPKRNQCLSALLLRDSLISLSNSTKFFQLPGYTGPIVKVFTKNYLDKKIFEELMGAVVRNEFVNSEAFINFTQIENHDLQQVFINTFKIETLYDSLPQSEKDKVFAKLKDKPSEAPFIVYVLNSIDVNSTYFKSIFENIHKPSFEVWSLGRDERGVYSYLISNPTIKANADLLGKILLSDELSRSKLLTLITNDSVLDVFKNKNFADLKCKVGSKVIDRLLESEIADKEKTAFEMLYFLSIDCITSKLKSHNLISSTTPSYFKKMCPTDGFSNHCLSFFDKTWLDKVKSCEKQEQCSNNNSLFRYNKETSKDEMDFYLRNYLSVEKYPKINGHLNTKDYYYLLVTNTNRGWNLPSNLKSVCLNNKCQPDLPVCDPARLYQTILTHYVNLPGNKCTSDNECSFRGYLFEGDALLQHAIYFPANKNMLETVDDYLTYTISNSCEFRWTEKFKQEVAKLSASFVDTKEACIKNTCQLIKRK
ncbi:MAG: hypothetical protein ACXVCE_04525 [Bacteriovorax sp.]